MTCGGQAYKTAYSCSAAGQWPVVTLNFTTKAEKIFQSRWNWWVGEQVGKQHPVCIGNVILQFCIANHWEEEIASGDIEQAKEFLLVIWVQVSTDKQPAATSWLQLVQVVTNNAQHILLHGRSITDSRKSSHIIFMEDATGGEESQRLADGSGGGVKWYYPRADLSVRQQCWTPG